MAYVLATGLAPEIVRKLTLLEMKALRELLDRK